MLYADNKLSGGDQRPTEGYIPFRCSSGRPNGSSGLMSLSENLSSRPLQGGRAADKRLAACILHVVRSMGYSCAPVLTHLRFLLVYQDIR